MDRSVHEAGVDICTVFTLSVVCVALGICLT